jgi:transposase
MNQQRSFFDEQDRLDKLNALIDWNIFRPQLKRCFKKEPKGPGGRPPFDYVLMFKILILQRLYNLSDALMQHQILDRLSFQRFLGQGLYASVPDEKTIWLFREVSSKQEIIEKLFDRYTAHLEKQGLITNKGSIIDASLVEVPRQRNSREENAKIRGGLFPRGGMKILARCGRKTRMPDGPRRTRKPSRNEGCEARFMRRRIEINL